MWDNKTNQRKCGKLGWGISRPPRPLGIQSLGNCAPNFNQKCEVKGFCKISYYMLYKLVCTEQKAKFKPNFHFRTIKRFFLQVRTSTLELNERKYKNETAMDIYSNWGSVRLKYAS